MAGETGRIRFQTTTSGRQHSLYGNPRRTKTFTICYGQQALHIITRFLCSALLCSLLVTSHALLTLSASRGTRPFLCRFASLGTLRPCFLMSLAPFPCRLAYIITQLTFLSIVSSLTTITFFLFPLNPD